MEDALLAPKAFGENQPRNSEEEGSEATLHGLFQPALDPGVDPGGRHPG